MENKTDHMMIMNLEVVMEKILKLHPRRLEGTEEIIYGATKHMELSSNCIT